MNPSNYKLIDLVESQPKSALINSNPTIDKIANLVTDFLLLKSRYDNKRMDHTNKTAIGGVLFYFTIREDGSYFLSSTTHPSMWNYNNIKLDILQMEDVIYKNIGKYM